MVGSPRNYSHVGSVPNNSIVKNMTLVPLIRSPRKTARLPAIKVSHGRAATIHFTE